MKRIIPLLIVLLAATPARAEEITLATYNVENFHKHFAAHRLTTQPIAQDPVGKEILNDLSKDNDKANWAVAEVILDKQFNPDILVIEEGCDQADLSFFNRRWLNDAFETAIAFPTNTEHHQNLCMLLKPGFKILERQDKYYLEPDPAGGNERGARLFARGPAFCLIQAPSGYKFWVGVTHQKSKAVGAGPTTGPATTQTVSGDQESSGGGDTPELFQRKLDAAKWRIREAARTHQIMKELEQRGPNDVMLLGDMNDDLGFDPYEKTAGADGVATLVGPAEDGFILATRPLADAHQFSYGGYWRPRFRSLIDHVVISKEMADQVEEVKIFTAGLARVASDHYPVMVKIKSDPAEAK